MKELQEDKLRVREVYALESIAKSLNQIADILFKGVKCNIEGEIESTGTFEIKEDEDE